MKRLLAGFLVLLAVQVQAQVPDFDEFKSIIQSFSGELASSLPLAAAVGGNWSDAYIGQLVPSVPPHLGIGITTGAVLISKDTMQKLLNNFNTALPTELRDWGLPLPVVVADARVGGLFLPFDVGFKVGFIPKPVTDMFPTYEVQYLSIGADVRWAILQDSIVTPALSIGAGYTYLTGSAYLPIDDVITLDNVPYNDGLDHTDGTLTFTDPKLGVKWTSNVIDLKAQISKNLLILTPYLGVAASLAVSEAGAGWYSTLMLSSGATGQDAVNQIKAGAASYGVAVPDLNPDGISVLSAVNGWGFRIYGGTSINIFVIKIDLKGMYNVTTGNIGADIGVRFQL